jgi:hypothetical protein
MRTEKHDLQFNNKFMHFRQRMHKNRRCMNSGYFRMIRLFNLSTRLYTTINACQAIRSASFTRKEPSRSSSCSSDQSAARDLLIGPHYSRRGNRKINGQKPGSAWANSHHIETEHLNNCEAAILERWVHSFMCTYYEAYFDFHFFNVDGETDRVVTRTVI